MADGDKTAQPGDIEELLGGLSPSPLGPGAIVRRHYDSSSDDDGSLDKSLRTPGSGGSSEYSPESENAQRWDPTSSEKKGWPDSDDGGVGDAAASPVSGGGGGAAAAMTPPPAPADFETALMEYELKFLEIEREADANKLAAANKTIEKLLAELAASGSDKKKVLAQEKQLNAQFAYTKELQQKLASAEKRNTALSRKAERRSTAGKPPPKFDESLRW